MKTKFPAAHTAEGFRTYKEVSMKTDFTDKRIAVVGTGGVGGYLCAMLGKALPHVSAVARGARYESIVQNGLVLHSDLNGEIISRPETVVRSSADLNEQDYIIVAVKNYSLGDAIKELKSGHAVGAETVIVPVMNGVDCGNRLREAFPDNIIIDSVIYIVSMARSDFSIEQQGNFADLRIGIRGDNSESAPDDASAALQEFSAILERADIRHKISKNVDVDIWRKYILNCAYNVATAAWDLPIGGLRSDPEKSADYASLAREAWQVGLALGVPLEEAHLASILDKFEKYDDQATSSLQRDIHDGKTSEYETFSGFIVKEGARLGIPTPVSSRYYQLILCRVKAKSDIN